jgi:hypothetical protein
MPKGVTATMMRKKKMPGAQEKTSAPLRGIGSFRGRRLRRLRATPDRSMPFIPEGQHTPNARIRDMDIETERVRKNRMNPGERLLLYICMRWML